MQSGKKNKNRLDSFRNAFNGILVFFRAEVNARIQLIAAIIVILLSLFLRLSDFEWMLIISAICLVFISELFNTAIEKICDFISPEYHEQIKVIKDLSAGAVLICAVLSAIIGIFILLPKVLNLF